MMKLCELQALIIDMDGVLYRGNTPIAGAQAFMAWLEACQFPFVLVTNNSTLDAQAYERKLAAMDICVPASQILTSAVATADYLAHNFAPGSRVFVVGESGLEMSVAARGFVLTDQRPEVVVVGYDRQLTYAKLRTAALAIRAGARFIATNPDRTLPTEAGQVPGAGSIVAALVAATDQEPFVIGKPGPHMFELALATLQRPRERTAVLGDHLMIDILGGQRLGLPTILVLSGVTEVAPSPNDPVQPTWIFDDLQQVACAWRESVGDVPAQQQRRPLRAR